MKTLEELGISLAPWVRYGDIVEDAEGNVIYNAYDDSDYPNAQLISAAPKMYNELWKICFGDSDTINCRKCKGAELGRCSSCPLGGARAALADASEEVVC